MGETRHGSNLQDFALLASWPTPCTQDGPNGGPSQGTDRLPGAAALASWPTATINDSTGSQYAYGKNKEHILKLPGAAQLSGPTPSGSPVGTEKRGQLNPRLSGWLQGYPIAWDLCAMKVISPRSSKKAKAECCVSEDTETP